MAPTLGELWFDIILVVIMACFFVKILMEY